MKGTLFYDVVKKEWYIWRRIDSPRSSNEATIGNTPEETLDEFNTYVFSRKPLEWKDIGLFEHSDETFNEKRSKYLSEFTPYSDEWFEAVARFYQESKQS